MSTNCRAGVIYVKKDGEQVSAKGEFTVCPGRWKRTMIIGADGRPQGFKKEGIVPFIEGAITDGSEVDVLKFFDTENSTFTIEFANGKTFVLKEACSAGDNTLKTGEGEISIRLEGMEGDFV